MSQSSIRCYVVDRNGGHTTINVFVGRAEGSRARAGQLIMRNEEALTVMRWLRSAPEDVDAELIDPASAALV